MRALLFLLAACQSFDTTTCPFRLHATQQLGVSVRCGEILRGKIRVPVVVFKGEERASRVPPLVYLSGGPGQSWDNLGLDQWEASMTQQAPYDLVFIEQRGTSLATPVLDCREKESLEGCVSRLQSEGIDPTEFNTTELANDVAAMRDLLGYEKIRLFGVSYGTAWALEIMRRHESMLDAVILDSVVSPATPPLEAQLPVIDLAFSTLFAACNANESCLQTYGDVEGKMLAVFDAQPEHRAEFFSTMFSLLSSEPLFLPAYIAETHASLPSWSPPDIDLGSGGGIALGLYLSVACSDNQYASADVIDAQLARIRPMFAEQLASIRAVLTQCQAWPFAERPRSDFSLFASPVRTLVLAGQVDPRTGVDWARQVASALGNATLVEVPLVGHNAVGSGHPCAVDAFRQFLLDGEIVTTCEAIPAFRRPTRELPAIRAPRL